MLILTILFICVLIIVSIQDITGMEIANWCHAAIAALAIVSVLAFDSPTYSSCIAGAFCVSVPMLLIALISRGAFGGGDIKLMAAGGMFLGARAVLASAVAAVFLGGIYSLYLLIVKRSARKTSFAFGPFLCAGMIAGQLFFR